MIDSKSDPSLLVSSWDTYWHGAQHGAAYTAGGTSHPLVLSFWEDFFKKPSTHSRTPRIIDIASGSGAVVDSAKAAFGGQLPDFTCLDISDSAISMLQKRFPEVHGIVADACSIPLESTSFDIVTSQFGIEYAGLEALDEVLRLVAPGGQLALLLHYQHGGIYRQCAASLDAIQKMQEARFIPNCITLFDAGFAVGRGADRKAFDSAAKQFAPAIRSVEAIMKQHGTEVADGTIVRLYKDVRTIYKRMAHYESTEVLDWLKRMQDEVRAYAGRMASMCESAIDAGAFEQLCDKLRGQNYELLRSEPLVVPGRDLPLAWALVAAKP